MTHRKSDTSVSKHPPYYILKDGKAVAEWNPRIANAFVGHHVDKTSLYASDGTEICISTVFLGIDHNYSGKDLPVLWETMIFWEGNGLDGWQQRYTGDKAARAGHKKAVALVKTALENVPDTMPKQQKLDKHIEELTVKFRKSNKEQNILIVPDALHHLRVYSLIDGVMRNWSVTVGRWFHTREEIIAFLEEKGWTIKL
jgi:hypothetical protein